MLNFKDYFKKEESFNPVNFVGGFAGNLLGQGAKSAANIAKGAGKTAAGLLGTAGGMVGGISHKILGSEENTKGSVNLVKSSAALIGSGLGDIVKGIVQLGGATSLITPFLRGMQASSESIVPKRFNRNRNYIQRLLGLNSNKETPFIINGAPKDSQEMIFLIDKWYEEAINNREIQVRGKPEIFIKKLMVLYNSTTTSVQLNKKIKYLLNTYFSNFEVVVIEAGKLLHTIDQEVFYSDSKIIRYIEFLYEKSKDPNVVLITQDNNLFVKELIKIHNEYLSSKNLVLGKKSKDTSAYMSHMKNKIIDIIARFFPNKTIKRN